MEQLNSQLLTKALNFHGQQLQKQWEGEFGESDLARRNVRDLNYLVYGQRQKNLSFQDRAKRLKLQQFLVKKSAAIYSKDLSGMELQHKKDDQNEDMFAVMPPFEMYVTSDRSKRLLYFTQNVKVGDLILGTIVNKQQAGMTLKVLCATNAGGNVRYVADINVKAFCPVANIVTAVDKKGVARSYMMNDYVCCEILDVIIDADKIVCGMKGTTRQPQDPPHQPPLGLITMEDFPIVYKKSLEHKNENFESVLEKSVGFNNPNNIHFLSELMGIREHTSLMDGLRGRFPENEYANELRQVQASKWAYRNVADGIDHFKAGKHVEAFQCLNKALNIDPKNVEGLVARGALFANSGNFQKAIEDFETALKLNPSHANARKYMGETLVALGRSYEEENKIEDARKAYQSCLSIIPYHEEAQNSLDFLKNKQQKHLVEPNLLLPLTQSKQTTDVNDALKQLLKSEEEEKKDKKKKKKSKKRKNRKHSSSSSSSSSSGSENSSSSSSSSSSDSSSSSNDSDFKKRKKQRRSRSHRRPKESSLSPLSKRMAMMDQSQDTPNSYNFSKPPGAGSSMQNAAPSAVTAPSYEFSFEQQHEPPQKSSEIDYETRLRAFLQETKDDSDYEDKVRKFLEESAKWKKGLKGGHVGGGGGTSDDKKKKKKKEKKKKDRKKKKDKKSKKSKGFDLADLDDHKKLRDAIKKELSKEKKSKRHSIPSDEEEYFLKSGYTKRFMDSLPDLEELESKLNAYYALEKESKVESPKRVLLDSPSPTREQKARQAVAEASASVGSSKWKLQLAAAAGSSNTSSRFKKKQDRQQQMAGDWPLEPPVDKYAAGKNGSTFDDLSVLKKTMAAQLRSGEPDKSARKAMGMKEGLPQKKPDSPKKVKTMPMIPNAAMIAAAAIPKPLVNTGQVVLDKFGNFRLMSPPDMKKSGGGHDMSIMPPVGNKGMTAAGGRRPPEPPGRPRSQSRSPKRRSRSRSKYSRSQSSSGSRSRSRSYQSRSRSYYSRSRSRSGSYYSRSRSRSRSYSGDRRRRRGNFRGRFNDRGTYYKPRFQNPRHNNRGGRGGGGGGGYYNNNNRDNRYNNDRDFRGRGRMNQYNPRGGRRLRGRFQRGGGYRDYRDRRYDRSRSRDRSRSYSDSGSDAAPSKKTNQDNKDKLNKYEAEGEPIKHDGPLSEGEDRDDYTENKTEKDAGYGGKWADKEGASGGPTGGGGGDGDGIPSETNIEEMDKFLDKDTPVLEF